MFTADRSSLTSQSVALVAAAAARTTSASRPSRRSRTPVLPAVVSIQVGARRQRGTGSGVVIDGAGYIVTNNHVISMAATDPDGASSR